MNLKIFVILVASLLLIGCNPVPKTTPVDQPDTIDAGVIVGVVAGSKYVRRIEDKDKGVTCWGAYRVGLHCIPNSQLR